MKGGFLKEVLWYALKEKIGQIIRPIPKVTIHGLVGSHPGSKYQGI
jgi:hypothetical protein